MLLFLVPNRLAFGRRTGDDCEQWCGYPLLNEHMLRAVPRKTIGRLALTSSLTS